MNTTDINKRVIDIQKRLVASSFGFADAVCDQVERMTEIYRPNWVSEEVMTIYRNLFRQCEEWRTSARKTCLEGYENLEKSSSCSC